MEDEPITLEEGGALLGGKRPWGRRTMERVITAGLLRDYGRGWSFGFPHRRA